MQTRKLLGGRFDTSLPITKTERNRALALIAVSLEPRIVPVADWQMVRHSVTFDVVGRRQCPMLSTPM
jgi:hypothetical protein